MKMLSNIERIIYNYLKKGNFFCWKCQYSSKEFASKAIQSMVFDAKTERYSNAWIIMCPRCEEYIPLIGLKE